MKKGDILIYDTEVCGYTAPYKYVVILEGRRSNWIDVKVIGMNKLKIPPFRHLEEMQ